MNVFGDSSWNEIPMTATEQPFTEVTEHGILRPANEISD